MLVLKTVTFYFIYCLFIQGEVAEMQNLRRSSNLSFCSGIFLSGWQDDGQCWDTSWHVVERFLQLLSVFCWCHWNSVFPWMSEWWGIYLDASAEPSSSAYHAMPRCCLLYEVLLFQNDSKLVCLLLPTALLCNLERAVCHVVYRHLLDLLTPGTKHLICDQGVSAVEQLHVEWEFWPPHCFGIVFAVLLSVPFSIHTE